MVRKKSKQALQAYASYTASLRKKHLNKPLKYLVLDEIYTFLWKKSIRYYVWTAIGYSDRGERLAFFHLDKSNGSAGAYPFFAQLPKAKAYYCDGNPAYPWVIGPSCHPGKGVKTNLVESLNAMVRQYNSRLHRKTKGYAKSFDALNASLAMVFIGKIIG